EVEQLHAAHGRDENVPRLDVAVHDQVLMREMHGGAHVPEEPHARADAEGAPLAILGDRRAVDVLHYKERQLPIRHACIQELRDSAMAERRKDLALCGEATTHLGGVGVRLYQLDGDELVVLPVVPTCEIHDAHATAPELADDAISTDPRTPR